MNKTHYFLAAAALLLAMPAQAIPMNTVDTVGDTTTFTHDFDVALPGTGGLVLGNNATSTNYDFVIDALGANTTLSFTHSGVGQTNKVSISNGSGYDVSWNLISQWNNNLENFSQSLGDLTAGTYSIVFNTGSDSRNQNTLKIKQLTVVAVSAVPEPGTYAQLLAGLGLLVVIARRKSIRQSASTSI